MRYKIYTLGCKVNEYESEVMENLLDKNGFVRSDNPEVCIINTCTVTNSADSKSRKMIRKVKKEFPTAIIVAVGCLIQNKEALLDNLEIDIALGNKEKSKIVDILNNYKKTKIKRVYNMDETDEFENMTLSNSDLTRAYIKIQDGCDNYCTYCIIPYVRGHVRSKKHEDILSEAKELIKQGHKEIVLTGIHTGNYHDDEYGFSDLLMDLSKIKGLERLRISSIEVTELDDKFLSVLKNSNVLTNHMHIPLQAGADNILKLMNRKYDTEYFINKINVIRSIRPDINITTDVIVGFPGETSEDFENTIDTIKKCGFTKLHVFPYSKREGTPAAKMKNQIDGNEKKKRVRRLLDLSKCLEIDYMNKYLDTTVSFIPEVYKDGYLTGHTDNYLLIKCAGEKGDLKKDIKVHTESVSYPYLMSTKVND